MTTIPNSRFPSQEAFEQILPGPIRRSLRQIALREYLLRIGTGLLKICVVFSILMLIQAVADYWLILPVIVRLMFLCADGAILIITARYVLKGPFLKTVSLANAALLAERQWPHLRQSLISLVQLTDGTGKSTMGSTRWTVHLAAQVQTQTERLNFASIISPLKVCGLIFLGVLWGFGIALIGYLTWPCSEISLERIFFIPTTTVVPITTDLVKPIGSDVELSALAKGVIPLDGRICITFAGKPTQYDTIIAKPDHSEVFNYDLHNLQASFTYTFYLNDGVGTSFKVDAKERPDITHLDCEVISPGLKAKKLESTNLSVPLGSHLRLFGESTSPLSSASITLKGVSVSIITAELGPHLSQFVADLAIDDKSLSAFSIHLVDTSKIDSINDTVYSIHVEAGQREVENKIPDHQILVKQLAPDSLKGSQNAKRPINPKESQQSRQAQESSQQSPMKQQSSPNPSQSKQVAKPPHNQPDKNAQSAQTQQKESVTPDTTQNPSPPSPNNQQMSPSSSQSIQDAPTTQTNPDNSDQKGESQKRESVTQDASQIPIQPIPDNQQTNNSDSSAAQSSTEIGSLGGGGDSLNPSSIGHILLTHKNAFRVDFENGKVPQNLIWRTAVLWDYDNNTWKNNSYVPGIAPVPMPDSNTYKQQITVLSSLGKSIPAFNCPISLPEINNQSDSTYWITGNILNLRGQSYLEARTQYEVTSADKVLAVEPSRAEMDRATAISRDRISKKVLNFADSLWNANKNPDAFARALASYYVTNHFIYTFDPGTYGSDFLEDFLFKRKKGVCSHYAYVSAILLRVEGIPSRVVLGFVGGVKNPDGTYDVSQDGAHAWDEYWSENLKKWVSADFTSFATADSHSQLNMPHTGGLNEVNASVDQINGPTRQSSDNQQSKPDVSKSAQDATRVPNNATDSAPKQQAPQKENGNKDLANNPTQQTLNNQPSNSNPSQPTLVPTTMPSNATDIAAKYQAPRLPVKQPPDPNLSQYTPNAPPLNSPNDGEPNGQPQLNNTSEDLPQNPTHQSADNQQSTPNIGRSHPNVPTAQIVGALTQQERAAIQQMQTEQYPDSYENEVNQYYKDIAK